MCITSTSNSQASLNTVSSVQADRMSTTAASALLTVEEMAAILRIGRNSAYQLVRQGRIRSIRIGRAIRIPLSSVYAFINGAMDIP